MLVPMIPVKTLAKMLLILMMGPSDKAPYTVTLSKEPAPSQDKSIDNGLSLTQLPNGYYQLQCVGSNESIYFSQQQLIAISDYMNNDEYLYICGNGPDLSRLASFIVKNDLLYLGMLELPNYSRSASSSSSSNTGGFSLWWGIKQRRPDNHARHTRTTIHRVSASDIIQSKKEGNIGKLRTIRGQLLDMQKSWFKNSKTIGFYMNMVDESLVDLGYSPTKQLHVCRELLKQGKIQALKDRLELVDKLLADKTWGSKKRRNEHGGEHNLKIEKYYLDHMYDGEATKLLRIIATGGNPEVDMALKNMKATWSTFSDADKQFVEQRLGFHPIHIADRIASKRTDLVQIQKQIEPPLIIITDLNADLLLTPVQDKIIHSLETAPNVEVLSTQLSTLANQVFAHYSNLDIYSTVVEDLVNESIQIIKTTDNPHTMIMHIIMVNHALSDLQDIVQQRPSLLERSPKLILQAACTFAVRCNPIGQTLATMEFWAGMAHFGWDVSVGRLYQSPDVYQARKDNFSKSINALSFEKLSQLDAEGWVHIGSTTLADFIYGRLDMASTIRYLQTLEQIGSTGQKALFIADKLRKGIDIAMTKNPLTVFTNKATNRLAQGIDEIKAPVTEIISSARALLESEYAKLVVQLEYEIAALRTIFDGTRKGFKSFAHKNLRINYKHILGMDIKFYSDKFDFSGFHHDLMGAIEKSGMVKFVNKVVDKTGAYSADLIVGGKLIRDKTFFPMTWSRQQVIDAIVEVYDNFKLTGLGAELQKDGKWLVEGTTKGGLTIQMTITQNSLITTAYPILR